MAAFCRISTAMEDMRAVRLIGSTIPLVPRMEMPPSIPRRGLNVFFAISLPPGA